jgi:nitrite reductase/ring-hydroxylating ferredoxin subunit
MTSTRGRNAGGQRFQEEGMRQDHPTSTYTSPPEDSRRHAEPQSPRRRLLRLGWVGTLLVLCGGQLWFLLRLFSSPNTPRGVRKSVVVGPVERFPPGSVTQLWKEGFLLVHASTGFLALSQQCTHNRCNVHYLPTENVMHCPCHGAQFSLAGTVLAGPATRPLERYATRIEDGYIVVDTTRLERFEPAG